MMTQDAQALIRALRQIEPNNRHLVESGSADETAATLDYIATTLRFRATLGLEDWQTSAKRNHDGPNGEHRPDIATCGHCGRSWDDGLITGITPTPSGRCPFEYDHVYEEEND